MLVVSVARRLGSGNSFARLSRCPAQAERAGKRRSGPAKLTMPARVFITGSSDGLGLMAGRLLIAQGHGARQGLLWPGRSFHWSWFRGDEPAGEIEVVSANDAVVLVFCWRALDGERWTPFEQRIPITWTTCHFGGTRAWFMCTQEIGGGSCCNRRTAKLYLRGHV
jgi:hypothetical protein